ETPRRKRVAGEVQKILVQAIRTVDLPNMTITTVQMSVCLRNAKVYVLPFLEGDKQILLKSLQEHTAFLRREVGSKLALRYVPELHFFIDDIFTQGARIENLLRSLPDASPPPSEGS
ncbi:MAG: 30S ribosome-binding factor RbfA, partial [Holosporales bacterium]|nr:30S ribosome-binding factor RbfA [Holosporales bacterium]